MTEYIELTTVGEMLKEEFIEPFNLTQNAYLFLQTEFIKL